MFTSLLRTKLYIPPLRRELVFRPRLVERLDDGLSHKLTLVSAPAGFGKTTLLSEWIQQIEPPVAWLSLDEGDNDPVRFWRYVVAALQTVHASVGQTAQAALESPQPPPLEALVTALINDIAAASEPLILILDDYHVINAALVHKSLGFFLDHLPPQMHLTITTRSDPPLALSRLRGRSELVELRAADLSFTAQEAAEFLNTVMQLALSARDVAALEERTEGWIVGLQMAALSLQGRSDKHAFVTAFAGDDRYIVDYLVEEVFQRQPQQVQTFLLQTSILKRLCGPLCDALTGRDDGQAILGYLEQVNLFTIPLDNRRYWYRYHRLFADLLRQRLKDAKETQELASLYLQASEWHEREGLIAEAVSYTLAVSDPTPAAALIERHVLDVFYRSETILVHNWLKALPESAIRTRPLLCAVYANAIVLASSISPDSLQVAGRWLRDAERALAAGPRDAGTPDAGDRVAHAEVAGFMATFRAYLTRFRGHPPQTVIDLSLQALDSLPQDSLRFRSALAYNLGAAYHALGDPEAAARAFAQARQIGQDSGDLFNTLAATHMQAQIARLSGRLHQAAAICREALESIVKASERAGRPLPIAGAVYVALGEVLLEWNDLQETEPALTRGLELMALTGTPGFLVDGYVALARLKRAQGDVAGALDLLERAEQLWAATADDVTAHRARLWLSQATDDPQYLVAATQWARERQITLDDGGQYDTERLTLARLFIAQRAAPPPSPGRSPSAQGGSRLQPLLSFLEGQLDLAQKSDQAGWAIEVLILQALALQAEGQGSQAVASLGRALALAEPEGYVRIFVDEGPSMTALLRQARARGVAPDYATRLLAAFGDTIQDEPQVAAAGHPSPAPRPSPLVEPLSPRELQVLQLVASGASNPEIAQELVIAVNTVKKHVGNIFGKLGVTSRTQAVARARGLGLVE